MGYSVNFYLDKSVSKSNLDAALQSNDKELKKDLENRINEIPLQLFLYLRSSGKTIKVYIERKCTQKQWDSNKQRANPRYFKSGATIFNNYLDRIQDQVCSIYEENLKNKVPTTKEHIKEVVYLANDKDYEGTPTPTFEKAFDEFIESSKLSKQKSTISVYNTCLKHLKEFSKKIHYPLLFNRIDLNFEDKFRDYLINDIGLTNNTISKQFKTIKTFLNYCTDRNYNQLLVYKKFNATEKEGEIYVLSLEELMKLIDFEFKDKKLSNVRDVFCFSCFTGLRYSDILNLKKENITNETINISSKKTNEKLIIPLNEFALNILKRHNKQDQILPVISSQKTNEYLKDIGEKIELNESVRKITYKGSKKIETYVPKKDVFTFHMGRKTFITNSLVLGMTETETKKISGHKKDENFRKYVNLADEYLKKKMNNAWNKNTVKEFVKN